MSLGNRIREARLARGMDQATLGSAVGATAATIARYESGVRNPGPQTIAKIASMLGVSADYLLGITDVPNPQYAKVYRNNPWIRRLSARQQIQVLPLVESGRLGRNIFRRDSGDTSMLDELSDEALSQIIEAALYAHRKDQEAGQQKQQ